MRHGGAPEGRDEERDHREPPLRTRTWHRPVEECGVPMAALSRIPRGIGAIVLALGASSATAMGQSLQLDPQPRRAAFTLAPGAAEAFLAAPGDQPAPAWYIRRPRLRRMSAPTCRAVDLPADDGQRRLRPGQLGARPGHRACDARRPGGTTWSRAGSGTSMTSLVNQFGHPYQGNNYFNVGRANGLNFYESAALTAFGSSTWEYFGETNHASLNDFINTTLGGIALGEAFHRAAWLIRDTRASGSGRLWREIAATVLDPIDGLQPIPERRREAGHGQARRHGSIGARRAGLAGCAVARLRHECFLDVGPAISRSGSPLRRSRGGPHPHAIRRDVDAVTLRRRRRNQRGASKGQAPRAAAERRQAAAGRAPELRL